jgi:lipoprotein-releasing system permease protein
MNLVLDIAWTHVRSRARQTAFAVAGVATGVGFSVMMASLMEGSQHDFMRQLINALPHITLSDERRHPPLQPAEAVYAVAEIRGLAPEARRKGIKNPLALVTALEAWLPGAVAPSVQTRAILRYAGRDLPVTVTGIDPQREPRVSQLATQMRQGSLASLYRTSYAMILVVSMSVMIGCLFG